MKLSWYRQFCEFSWCAVYNIILLYGLISIYRYVFARNSNTMVNPYYSSLLLVITSPCTCTNCYTCHDGIALKSGEIWSWIWIAMEIMFPLNLICDGHRLYKAHLDIVSVCPDCIIIHNDGGPLWYLLTYLFVYMECWEENFMKSGRHTYNLCQQSVSIALKLFYAIYVHFVPFYCICFYVYHMTTLQNISADCLILYKYVWIDI